MEYTKKWFKQNFNLTKDEMNEAIDFLNNQDNGLIIVLDYIEESLHFQDAHGLEDEKIEDMFNLSKVKKSIGVDNDLLDFFVIRYLNTGAMKLFNNNGFSVKVSSYTKFSKIRIRSNHKVYELKKDYQGDFQILPTRFKLFAGFVHLVNKEYDGFDHFIDRLVRKVADHDDITEESLKSVFGNFTFDTNLKDVSKNDMKKIKQAAYQCMIAFHVNGEMFFDARAAFK